MSCRSGGQAPPDGYTLLLGTISLSINPSLYPKLSYDPLKDFAGISMVSSTPFLMLANPSSPYASMKDLLDAARAGKTIHYATAGNGSGSHLFMESFTHTAGIKLTHVPYRGAAPAMNDVMGGQVPITFDNVLTALPLVKSGKLRALAGEHPRAIACGARDSHHGGGRCSRLRRDGMVRPFVPAATPKDIIARLHKEVAEAVRDPSVTKNCCNWARSRVSSTPEQLDAFYRSEMKRWGDVVRNAKVTLD